LLFEVCAEQGEEGLVRAVCFGQVDSHAVFDRVDARVAVVHDEGPNLVRAGAETELG
jgi:hypothetical protein